MRVSNPPLATVQSRLHSFTHHSTLPPSLPPCFHVDFLILSLFDTTPSTIKYNKEASPPTARLRNITFIRPFVTPFIAPLYPRPHNSSVSLLHL